MGKRLVVQLKKGEFSLRPGDPITIANTSIHRMFSRDTEPKSFAVGSISVSKPKKQVYKKVFVCSSRLRTFSLRDVTLQILTSARQLWPLSRECSLACRPIGTRDIPFTMVLSEDPGHSHQLPSV